MYFCFFFLAILLLVMLPLHRAAAEVAQPLKGTLTLKESATSSLIPISNAFLEFKGGTHKQRAITRSDGSFTINLDSVDIQLYDALVNQEVSVRPIAAGVGIMVISERFLDKDNPLLSRPITGKPQAIRHLFIPLVIDPALDPETAHAMHLLISYQKLIKAVLAASHSHGPDIQAAAESMSLRTHVLAPGKETTPHVRLSTHSEGLEFIVIRLPASDPHGYFIKQCLAFEALNALLGDHDLTRAAGDGWISLHSSATAAPDYTSAFLHELVDLTGWLLGLRLAKSPPLLFTLCSGAKPAVKPGKLYAIIREEHPATLKDLFTFLLKTGGKHDQPAIRAAIEQAGLEEFFKPLTTLTPQAEKEFKNLLNKLQELVGRWEKNRSQIESGECSFNHFMTEVGNLVSRCAYLAGPETVEHIRTPMEPPLLTQWISRWKQDNPDQESLLKEKGTELVTRTAAFYQNLTKAVSAIKELREKVDKDLDRYEAMLGKTVTSFFSSMDALFKNESSSRVSRWYSIWLNPHRHINVCETRLLQALDLADRIEENYLENIETARSELALQLGGTLQQINREIFHIKGKIVRNDVLSRTSDQIYIDMKRLADEYSASAGPTIEKCKSLLKRNGHLVDRDPSLIFYQSDGSRKLYMEDAVTSRAQSLLQGMERLSSNNLSNLTANLQKAIERLERIKKRLVETFAGDREAADLDESEIRSPHFSNIRINNKQLEEYGGIILISRGDLSRGRITVKGEFDPGDYAFQKVQVSTDYGTNWDEASGLKTWSFQLQVNDLQSYPVAIRVTDSEGNPFELSVSPIEIYLEP